MKSFFNFLSEARVSKAAEKAKRLGLTSDGQGGWRDRDGNVKARTVAGELKFVGQRGPGAEDPTGQRRGPAQPEAQPQAKSLNLRPNLGLRNLRMRRLMVTRRTVRPSP